MMNVKVDYIVCGFCGLTCDARHNYCPDCGAPLHDPQTSHGPHKDAFNGNGGYRSDFGWHEGRPPRPGDPGFESFWANHRVVEDHNDFSDTLATLFAGAILVASVYGLVQAFRNNDKQLNDGHK